MHSYLKTIGFSNLIHKKDIDQIIDEVIRQYDEKTVVESPDKCLYAELSKSYGCDVGISVFGEYDEDDLFHPEYYFPYFRGTGISTREDIVVEKHGGRESFAGACDDLRVGATLFFFLQNVGEYLDKKEKGNPAEVTSFMVNEYLAFINALVDTKSIKKKATITEM